MNRCMQRPPLRDRALGVTKGCPRRGARKVARGARNARIVRTIICFCACVATLNLYIVQPNGRHACHHVV